MSGPKGIRYEIEQERVQLAAALRRWRTLVNLLQAHASRCTALGVESAPAIPAVEPTGSAAAIDSHCNRIERDLASAKKDLEDILAARRRRQIVHDLEVGLAALKEREAAAEIAEDPDLSQRVRRKLATLLEPSAVLAESGCRILGSDPARARLLLADLDVRIRAANAHTEALRSERELLVELSAEARTMREPERISAHLESAGRALDHDDLATAELAAARAALDRQRAAEQSAQERTFVLDSVREVLGELGYTTTTVALETPAGLLRHRNSPDHAVLVAVDGNEIDLRTVRIADTDRTGDIAAEEQLCATLDELLTGLADRGVLPGRVRAAPPGVIEPPLLPVAATEPAAHRRVRTRRNSHDGSRRADR